MVFPAENSLFLLWTVKSVLRTNQCWDKSLQQHHSVNATPGQLTVLAPVNKNQTAVKKLNLQLGWAHNQGSKTFRLDVTTGNHAPIKFPLKFLLKVLMPHFAYPLLSVLGPNIKASSCISKATLEKLEPHRHSQVAGPGLLLLLLLKLLLRQLLWLKSHHLLSL